MTSWFLLQHCYTSFCHHDIWLSICIYDHPLLGTYITSSPLFLLVYPPYSYCCTPIVPILLLLCPYIIIVSSARIIFWPNEILYIEGRFFHLCHPRIFHLCNVKEVSPLKWLISKALICLFFYFGSWFHNIRYQSFGF